jgi:hypothetical protein
MAARRLLLRLVLLVAFGAMVVVSIHLTRRRDTALRVVGHEWERVIEIQEYTGRSWVVVREARTSGTSPTDPIAWPSALLQKTGTCDGCQRLGRRHESYQIRLIDPVVQRGHACSFEIDRWRAFAPLSRWQARFDPRSGAVDCGSLTPAD